MSIESARKISLKLSFSAFFRLWGRNPFEIDKTVMSAAFIGGLVADYRLSWGQRAFGGRGYQSDTAQLQGQPECHYGVRDRYGDGSCEACRHDG